LNNYLLFIIIGRLEWYRAYDSRQEQHLRKNLEEGPQDSIAEDYMHYHKGRSECAGELIRKIRDIEACEESEAGIMDAVVSMLAAQYAYEDLQNKLNQMSSEESLLATISGRRQKREKEEYYKGRADITKEMWEIAQEQIA